MNIQKIPAAYHSKGLQMQVVRSNDSSKADGSGFNNRHEQSKVNTLKTLNYMTTRINNAFGVKGIKGKLAGIFLMVLMFGASFPLNAQTTVDKRLYLKTGLGLSRVVPTSGTVQSTTALSKTSVAYAASTTGKTAQGGSLTSLTISHTTGSGTDRLMVVSIASKPDVPITNVTYGGLALTKLGEQINGTTAKTELWYRIAPVSGTANVVISWTGTLEASAGVTTFTGVDQLNPFGAVATNSGSADPTSLNVVSNIGDIVIDAVGKTGTAPSVVTSTPVQTPIFNDGTNSIKVASSYKIASTGTTPMGWTATGGAYTWSTIGVAVKGTSNDISFTQSPVMCSPFTIKTGQPITILANAAVTSGTASGATIPFYAVLKDGSTTIFSSSTATNSGLGATNSTGTLTWTGNIASDYILPAGNPLTLTVYSDYTSANIRVDYDASSKISYIQLPTTSYINVDNINVYNAAYPGGSIITQGGPNVTKYIRAVVSDPFGFDDITGLDLSIAGGSAVAATSVATSGCTRTYEYAWTPATTGAFTIASTAKEGTEATVTATKSVSPSFDVTKPSLTVTKTKTSPASGPFKINDNIVYNIAIQNTGNTAITTLPLTDTYSTSCLQYVSSSITPSNISGGIISWSNLGTLAVSGTTNVTLTMKVVGNCDPATNTATVEGAKNADNTVADTKTSIVNINVDLAPVAVADSYCIQASTALSVLSNDTDGDLAGFLLVPANAALYNVTVISGPTLGSATINGDKTIQFDPAGGTAMTENQTTTFTYRVAEIANPTLYSDNTVTVLYSVTNDAPITGADVANTTTELPVIINVLSNDSDPDGQLQTPTISISPENGTAVVNADKTITYTPFAGFSGTDVFTYQICDNGCPGSVCSTATATITVVYAYYVCKEGSSTLSVNAVTGATGYQWTLPAGAIPTTSYTGTLPNPVTTTPSIGVNWSGVTSGTNYNICVAPTNDCGPGTSQCVNVVVNQVALVPTPNHLMCNGVNNGSISLAVSGGVAPYTYAWTKTADGSYLANVQNPGGLSPGEYNVTVTDKNGCVASTSTTITQPATAVSVTGSAVNATFPSSDGSISITPSGGTGTYTYLWSNGATTQNISGLAAGTYNVTVSDANGCSIVEYFTVNSIGSPLAISSSVVTNVRCNGGSTGEIDIEVIGGIGTYTYAWVASSGGPVPSGQVSSQDLTTLPAGTYQVTVSSTGYPNVVLSGIVVSQPAVLSASSSKTNVTCFGDSNGSVTVSPAGGTAPYSYVWTKDAVNTGAISQNLTNLGPGTYAVTITDANGCTTSTSQTITQPTVISLSGVVTNASCNPVENGTITLTVSGGTPFASPIFYTYLWSNGATTKDISVSSPGTYSVTVTDAAGCKTGESFEVKNICVEVTKTILTGPTNNNDGTYTLTYQVKVKNSGSTDLTSVQATDNLSTTFAAATSFTGVSISSSKFTVNGSYNGTTVTNLLASSQALIAGEEGFINITVTVTPGATLSYTNNAGGSGVSAGITTTGSGSVGVTFTESPLIGVAKQLTAGPTINADGSYNLTFTFKVRNFGDVPLRNVQVTDNLITTFGASATITVLSLSSSDMTVNSSYTGIGTNNLLAGTDVMAVNEVNTIVLALKVTPTDAGPFNNSASASASGPGATGTTDTSQNGVNPDPDSDDNPANNSVATPVSFPENPEIGAAKRLVGSPVNNNDGTYSLTYEITVKNTGDVALKNIQVTDNLATTFPGKTVEKVSLTSGYFTVNSSYDGVGVNNLLTGVNTLAANAQYNILLTVKVTPGSSLGVYNNSATASGASIFNTAVNDVSHNGIDVDPENDGTSNNSTVTPVTFTETPKIGIAKSVGTPVNNHDGTYTVAYTIYVKNMGNVPLTNVQVADTLANTFTGASSSIFQSVSATGGLTVNTSYDGITPNTNLLVAASSSVAYNTTATITLSVKVTPGTKLGTYNNWASGTATGPGLTSVSDVSYDGTNPDPDGDGNPTNNALPTPLTFEENPQIAVTKTIFSVTDNLDGTYNIIYDIRIDNTGDVPLTNVQVSDDLVKAFSGAPGFSNPTVTVHQQPIGSTLTINSGFTGISPNVNLLNGTDTLLYQDYAILRLSVRVNTGIPGTALSKGGQYTNEVYALANSPGGSYIMNTATVSKTFYQQPAINIIKTLVSNVLNPDGTSTIKFKLEIENMGDVYLNNLKIYDDIVAQFDGLNPTNFVASEGLSLAVNPAWNGTSTSNILAPNQVFDPEITQKYYVYISFIVSPQVAPITSTANTYGDGPLGGGSVTASDNELVTFSTNADDEEICAWRSTKIGIWSDATVWQKLICGAGWLPSTTPPNNDRPIYVIHSVTVSSTVIADSVIIEPTGSVSACAPLTIDNQLVFKVDASGNAGKLNNCNGCPTNNLTMNPTARAIVRKAYGTGWSMISFPFQVLQANIFKAGTSTPALWGDLESTTYKDFYMGQYDPAKRSNNATPSTTSSANFSSVSPKELVPYKGYITAGKSPAYGSIDFTSVPGTQLDFCSAVTSTIYAARGTAGVCNEGWNLVGTPYVTSYDLVNASTAPFYVLNTNGTYSTVVAAESKVLEPFSAFFAQIKGTSNSSVNYTITGQQLLVRALKPFDEISLDFSNTTYTDNTRIRLKEGALIGFDDSEDAIKFLSSSSAIPQIYSELPGACAVIALNTLPESTKQVDFKVRTGSIGNYTIKLSNKEKVYGLTKVILVDTETGIQTNLLEKDAYTFTNTSTGISSRFYIQFARENASGIYNTGNGITIKNQGNKITLSGLNGAARVNMYDVVGKLIYQFNEINNDNSFYVGIPGVYIMDINSGTENTRMKVLIKNQER